MSELMYRVVLIDPDEGTPTSTVFMNKSDVAKQSYLLALLFPHHKVCIVAEVPTALMGNL